VRHSLLVVGVLLSTKRVQKNFGRPVEWALVQDYPWSAPQLRKVEPQ